MGIGLSWREGLKLRKTPWEIVRQLAQALKTRVVTDPLPAVTQREGLFSWMGAEPTGILFLISEDKNFMQSGDGLRLDETTRQPLNFNEMDSNPADF